RQRNCPIQSLFHRSALLRAREGRVSHDNWEFRMIADMMPLFGTRESSKPSNGRYAGERHDPRKNTKLDLMPARFEGAISDLVAAGHFAISIALRVLRRHRQPASAP